MNDSAVQVIDPAREASLRSIGQISYLLHAIVAVGAVLPGDRITGHVAGVGEVALTIGPAP